MKRRFNEETQKIDVIEKANYQELVDSVYAAARSGITNIRVRVRDDEYLDLLGDVPTREFKENKLREGSGDIYINAHMYHGIPVMDVTVNDERIYSSDWDSLNQARAAAADLRAFLHNRVGGLKELLNTWDHSYVPVDDDLLTEAQKEKLLDEFDWSGLRIELVERGNFICLYAYLENGDCCHNTIWGKEDKKSADYAWNDLKKYLEEFGESSDPVEVLTDWEENLHIPNLNAAPGEKLYGPYEYTLDQCVKVVKNSMYGVIQSAKGLKSTFKALKRHVANRSKFTDDFDGLTDEDLMEIAQAVYDDVRRR